MTKLVPIFVQNRLTGVYAIMKPLEKSERIEKMLKESEKRLRTLVNSMPAFVIFKDHEGRWLEANDYALSCFNFHHVPYRGKKIVNSFNIMKHTEKPFTLRRSR